MPAHLAIDKPKRRGNPNWVKGMPGLTRRRSSPIGRIIRRHLEALLAEHFDKPITEALTELAKKHINGIEGRLVEKALEGDKRAWELLLDTKKAKQPEPAPKPEPMFAPDVLEALVDHNRSLFPDTTGTKQDGDCG